MSSVPARPPRRSRPSTLGRLVETFWIVDLMVLGLVAFFIIVGAGSSATVVIVGCVLAVAYAAHAVRRHNRRARGERSMEELRDRERRGF